MQFHLALFNTIPFDIDFYQFPQLCEVFEGSVGLETHRKR